MLTALCCLQLDKWTAAYEAEEARKEKERQAAMAGDGWTVVVRSKVGAGGWAAGTSKENC
jgi:hypothetical protein